MKYIVFYILFFFAVIHGLNVAVPHCAPEIKKTEATDRLTATAHLNAIISVLLDSNSFADLSARQVNSITSNVARRYRPGEFLCDKIFSYLSVGQGMTIGQLLKKSSLSSQECAALQKNGGYYIYTLRRIII